MYFVTKNGNITCKFLCLGENRGSNRYSAVKRQKSLTSGGIRP